MSRPDRAPRPVNTIRGATMVDRPGRVDIAIDAARIGQITPARSQPMLGEPNPPGVVDAEGHLVIPALVEAHCHLDKTLFGRPWVPHSAEDTLTSRIGNDRRRRAELGLPDRRASRALLGHMADCGTMMVRTHTDVDPDVGVAGVHLVSEVAAELSARVEVQQVAFPQHGLLSLPGTVDLMRASLNEGASVVGGLDPAGEGDARRYLDTVFSLAEQADADVDLHLHGRGDRALDEIDLILERVRTHGLARRATISHVYCFGDLDDQQSKALAERLATAGVAVVTAAPYSYPVAPLRILREAGVVVGCGHDGIRDLWGPYGSGDMLDRARHVASRSGFRADADIELALAAATAGGAAVLTGRAVGIEVGQPADLVLVPVTHAAEAVVAAPFPRVLIRAGEIVTAGVASSAASGDPTHDVPAATEDTSQR